MTILLFFGNFSKPSASHKNNNILTNNNIPETNVSFGEYEKYPISNR